MALRRIQQKKEKRRKVIMGLVLSLLMVLSGFGVYLSGQQSANPVIPDKGLKFTLDIEQQIYTTEIGDKELMFFSLPTNVEGITVPESVRPLTQQAQALILNFDPESHPTNLQVIDIIRLDLTTSINKPMINTMNQESVNYQLPIITCANSTIQAPVVTFIESPSPSITINGSCIELKGNGTGFLQVRDRFIYEYYGVYHDE